MRLIVGLGNPGPRYARTRHNAGFHVVDRLAELLGAGAWREGRGAKSAQARHPESGPVVLVKPLSYMNRSGRPTAALLAETGAGPEDLLVVADELQLPLGRIRLRPKGSAGGHNGLKSVIEYLGTDAFARLRVGVGPLPAGADRADFVLSDIPRADWPAYQESVERAASAALLWIAEGAERAMAVYNAAPELG